ncbi:hypothetical protein, partial [Sphingomonas sp. SRS2]|uniref:hypothetical protein n=1 Tax=Sphingomonas sp. SRS2 TaxID=133190 RepID=UPI001F47949F
ITPLPYRSGTSFLAWAIVNNNQPVPDVFSKMTKIAASGRLGLIANSDLASLCDVEGMRIPIRACLARAATSGTQSSRRRRSD